MYRMLNVCVVLGAILLGLAAVAGAAELPGGNAYIAALDEAVAKNDLDAEKALLYKFAYLYDQNEIPAAWRPVSSEPLKCATGIMSDYERLRSKLSAGAVERIENFQALARAGGEKYTYTSPSGRFRFTYYTSGSNAVPAADVDPANGIPDRVELCALYLDEVWEREIVDMGFTAPPNTPYPVSFESMTAYGYTQPLGGLSTRIALHNTFVGFAPNDDPDGNELGAAKVTCAHEFKHASQYAQSYWSEDGWVELDATWMEDMVFDQVNDYYNYLSSGSGITAPTQSLNHGGTGSYEDCIWQHWMSETYGEEIVSEFWDWRSTHSNQTVLNSYNAILATRGSSLAEAYPQFAAWNFATRSKSLDGFGYEEAADYPNSQTTNVFSYPYSLTNSTAHLAARNLYCFALSTRPGDLQVTFDGQDGAELHVMAVLKPSTGGYVFEEVPLDGDNDCEGFALSVPAPQLTWAGIIVVNSRASTSTAGWTIGLDVVESIPEPAAAVTPATIATELEAGEIGYETVTVSNVGDAGSLLLFTTSDMTVDPSLLSKGDAVVTPVPAGTASRYAGDCVYGHDDVGSLAGRDNNYWSGEETYAIKVDPTAGCACGDGFDVRGVHMYLYLQTGSAPRVRAKLAADDGGQPGVILDVSDPFEVSSPASAGYYDVEIPTDFQCRDTEGGPYYVLFEFMNSAGPVGLPVVVASTPNTFFNDRGDGWVDLTGGGPAGGDLFIWADVDCCADPVSFISMISPNGGEVLEAGADAALTWTALGTDYVDLDLSLDGGVTWNPLFTGTPNDGSESWTVGSATSSDCLVRVTAVGSGDMDVSDGTFVIFADVPWLDVAPAGGAVVAGTSADLTLTIDSTGLAAGTYRGYAVVTHNAPGGPEVVTVDLEVSDSSTAVEGAPVAFALAGNHPNPFNPSTRILFTLPEPGEASVDVLDLQGRVVRNLHSGELPRGESSLEWDGRDDRGRSVASGTYVARLRAAGMSATHKMVLAR